MGEQVSKGPQPRSKESIRTIDGLVDNFISQAQATKELGVQKIWSGGEKTRDQDEKEGRDMILGELSDILAQRFHLHLRVFDQTRLEDFKIHARRFLQESRIRFVQELFHMAHGNNKALVKQKLEEMYKNLLNWYFKEKREKSFAGKTIEEIISSVGEKTKKATEVHGAPQMARPKWGNDFHAAMGSPTSAREVHGGRMSGR